MIAVDTNIIVYAHREDSPFHKEALSVMTTLAEQKTRWAIPWPCVHEFISIVTHPKIYNPPTPISIAIAAICQWIESPNCMMLSEGPTYFKHLASLCESGKIQGGMVHDARIAALSLGNGVKILYTADRDFSRFDSLKFKTL